MFQELRAAAVLFLILSIVTGIAYPLVVTGVAQVVFPAKANGSFIQQGGKPVGSELIGQTFADAKHFWNRADSGRNRGDLCGHCLKKRPGKSFLYRWQREHIKSRQILCRTRDPSEKEEAMF